MCARPMPRRRRPRPAWSTRGTSCGSRPPTSSSPRSRARNSWTSGSRASARRRSSCARRSRELRAGTRDPRRHADLTGQPWHRPAQPGHRAKRPGRRRGGAGPPDRPHGSSGRGRRLQLLQPLDDRYDHASHRGARPFAPGAERARERPSRPGRGRGRARRVLADADLRRGHRLQRHAGDRHRVQQQQPAQSPAELESVQRLLAGRPRS